MLAPASATIDAPWSKQQRAAHPLKSGRHKTVGIGSGVPVQIIARGQREACCLTVIGIEPAERHQRAVGLRGPDAVGLVPVGACNNAGTFGIKLAWIGVTVVPATMVASYSEIRL